MSEVSAETLANRPQFIYKLMIDKEDPTGYYIPSMHCRMKVISDAANGAFEKALMALGEPPRNYKWNITVEGIDEVTDMVATDQETTSE